MARKDEVTVKLGKEAHALLQYTLAVDPQHRGDTVKGTLTRLTWRFVATRLREMGIGQYQLAKAGLPVAAMTAAIDAEK